MYISFVADRICGKHGSISAEVTWYALLHLAHMANQFHNLRTRNKKCWLMPMYSYYSGDQYERLTDDSFSRVINSPAWNKNPTPLWSVQNFEHKGLLLGAVKKLFHFDTTFPIELTLRVKRRKTSYASNICFLSKELNAAIINAEKWLRLADANEERDWHCDFLGAHNGNRFKRRRENAPSYFA